MKKHHQISILFVLVLFCETFLFAQENTTNSVLSTGQWIKVGVVKSGVYKLNYAFFKNNGLISNNSDPANIKVFGNGGSMLPQKNSMPRPDDLLESSVYVSGDEDGSFDKSDFVLFYAEGPHTIVSDSVSESIKVVRNIYSDTSYYFITASEGVGKRIQSAPLVDGGEVLNYFDEYIYHEKDEVNILADKIGSESGSGRDWYGERFNDNSNLSFNVSLKGLKSEYPVKVFSSVVASSTSPVKFSLNINNSEVGSHSLSAIAPGRYNIKGFKDEKLFQVILPVISDLTKSTINYSFIGRQWGFLNYFTITFKKELVLTDNQLSFRSFNSLANQATKFQIGGVSSNTFVWDVTEKSTPVRFPLTYNAGIAEFSSTTDRLKEFVAFNPEKIDAPFIIGRVANQNLHSIATADMIIVSYPGFLPAAERLAKFRSEKSGMNIAVVTPIQIYNEFSSGKQDISAIRDFIRMVYKRDQKLKYVLLFGDCSYDYKNRIKENTNYVPVYESRESLHPIGSYSSDDYFGFMDEEEGDWVEDSNGDHTVELGIGRIPAVSLKEAQQIVDKIISYANHPRNLGNWRNRVTFVSDDADANIHLNDAEKLAKLVDTSANVSIKKIHLAAFPQLPAPQNTSPGAKSALMETFRQGSLILNYTGHGSATVLTDERIIDISDVEKLNNKERLPLLVTATCDFGKYDNPLVRSGAEIALANPRGGAIALVTTTRPVFSSTNYILNKAFYEAAFNKIDGRMPALGDIIKFTKNNSLNGSINRNFALLGDPSLTLAYPEHEIEILKINDMDILLEKDTLKALSIVKIEGSIKKSDGNIYSDFNGVIDITINDKPTTIKTVGDYETPVTSYSNYENVVFKGSFSVKNGLFAFSFRLPKNMNYQIGKADISFYAYDNNNLTDAAGSIRDCIIGGSSSDFPEDRNPPSITMYLNDSTFKNGEKVMENPVMIAHLSDESGINITRTSVGQDLTAYLISEESQEIALNNYFQPQLDNYSAGTIVYPMHNLAEGNYSLHLKVWDIYNNSNEKKIDFVVVRNQNINISKLFNFPNPFSSTEGTTFFFNLDRYEEDLDINISIHSVKGELIKSINHVIYKSDNEISDIVWNGRSDSGGNIPTGVYIYRLEIRSLSNKNKGVRSERLVIIN